MQQKEVRHLATTTPPPTTATHAKKPARVIAAGDPAACGCWFFSLSASAAAAAAESSARASSLRRVVLSLSNLATTAARVTYRHKPPAPVPYRSLVNTCVIVVYNSGDVVCRGEGEEKRGDAMHCSRTASSVRRLLSPHHRLFFQLEFVCLSMEIGVDG